MPEVLSERPVGLPIRTRFQGALGLWPVKLFKALERSATMWRARLSPLLSALVVSCALLPLVVCGMMTAAAPPLLSAEPLPEQRCASAPPLAGLSLTEEEQELLQHVCWPTGPEGEPLAHEAVAAALGGERRGVPAGVNCTVVQW